MSRIRRKKRMTHTTMESTLNRKRRRGRRKALPLLILAILLAALLTGGTLFFAMHGHREPAGSSAELPSAPSATAHRALPRDFIDRNTASKYILLRDVTGGVDLYAKAADERCYPASLTKLMTAVVALEHSTPDAEVTVGDEVRLIASDSSRAYLTQGTRLTVEQLLQALLLPSGNDAAYTLAVYTGRLIATDNALDNRAAVSVFCTAMNKKAAQLGCTGTHFVNPDGIHSDDHYTTAADMMKIAECALNQEVIARTVALPKVNTKLLSGQTVTWTNTNKLIRQGNAFSYDGATGMKTGSTDEAGYCLVASATRDGKTSIAVIMGSPSDSGRWEDAGGLLDISFQ